DDVMVGVSDQRLGLAKRLRQTFEPAAQRRGELDDASDLAVLGTRGLEMHASHVPADGDGHVRAIRVVAMTALTLYRERVGLHVRGGAQWRSFRFSISRVAWWCAPAWASATSTHRSRRRFPRPAIRSTSRAGCLRSTRSRRSTSPTSMRSRGGATTARRLAGLR